MHGHEHAAVIKPVGQALVLNQMRFPTDLREPSALQFPTDKEITDKELEVALKLIKQETKPFIPEDLHDTYTEELEVAIERKTKGLRLSPQGPKVKQDATASARDLLRALKESLK
jgi:DNA end-binding protein Ku